MLAMTIMEGACVGVTAGFLVGWMVAVEMVGRMIRRDPGAFRARVLRG